jgi:ferredoxin
MQVELDQDKCVGAGQCVLAAPDVFDQREDDGIAVLLNDTSPDELTADVEQAAAVCPAMAIRLAAVAS